MKIEIELNELTHLKNEITRKDQHIKQLEEDLRALDENKLKNDAVRLSYWLLENYMQCIFTKLGFGNFTRNSVRVSSGLENYVGKMWWNAPEKLDIEIGAEVTNKFKSAFLEIGLMRDPRKKQQDEDDYPLNPLPTGN